MSTKVVVAMAMATKYYDVNLYDYFLRVVPSDERVQRYERAVIMTVYGLSLTLQQLPAEYLIQSKATWEPLLSEKRLWKLGKHQNPFVRILPILLGEDFRLLNY